MSNLSIFLKKNKIEIENIFYPATKSLRDENGEPAMWELRPLTTAEDERIRKDCTKEIPIPGKRNATQSKLDLNEYLVHQMTTAIVSPNLYSAELQDSYGVKTPEDLLRAMLSNPMEFAALGYAMREHSGLGVDISEEVATAKN